MKTLVIGLNWLGDILMSFPALNVAGDVSEPLTVLSRPHLATTYHLHPRVGEVIPHDTTQSLWLQLATLRKLRQRAFDRIIVFPGSFRTALTAFFCGGLKRLGYAGDGRSLLLHEALALPDDLVKRHESGLYQDLMTHAGHVLHPEPLIPRLPGTQEQTSLLEKLGVPPTSGFLALAPGAAFGAAKRWPPDHFREIARRWLTEIGTPVVLTGSSGEASITAQIQADLAGPVINLAGKTSILELATLLSRSTLLVANDSGTMHLGALVDTPLVVPIGPTDPIRTGPMSKDVALVKARRDHEPCRQRVCPRKGLSCLEQLHPDLIWDAMQEFLHRPKP